MPEEIVTRRTNNVNLSSYHKTWMVVYSVTNGADPMKHHTTDDFQIFQNEYDSDGNITLDAYMEARVFFNEITGLEKTHPDKKKGRVWTANMGPVILSTDAYEGVTFDEIINKSSTKE